MRAPANWERVRTVFHGALDCPRETRAAFLAKQSDGDEAVRREVESLLAAHDAAEGFLDEPVPGPTSDHDLLASTPRLAMGSRLGAFEILDLLGAGGMGEVYRARDTRLDRFVAIKVISSELAIDAARPGSLRTRGADYLQIDAPAHLHRLRRRLGTGGRERRAVPRHGTAPRRDPRGSAEAPGHVGRAGAAIRRRDCRRSCDSPRSGHRPSRPEARKRHAHQVGRQAARLRAGAAAGVRGSGTPVLHGVEQRCVDERGNDPRHAALHGTGAASRRGGGRARGSVRLRGGPARNADWHRERSRPSHPRR